MPDNQIYSSTSKREQWVVVCGTGELVGPFESWQSAERWRFHHRRVNGSIHQLRRQSEVGP